MQRSENAALVGNARHGSNLLSFAYAQFTSLDAPCTCGSAETDMNFADKSGPCEAMGRLSLQCTIIGKYEPSCRA
jgi:hypothetical protein